MTLDMSLDANISGDPRTRFLAVTPLYHWIAVKGTTFAEAVEAGLGGQNWLVETADATNLCYAPATSGRAWLREVGRYRFGISKHDRFGCVDSAPFADFDRDVVAAPSAGPVRRVSVRRCFAFTNFLELHFPPTRVIESLPRRLIDAARVGAEATDGRERRPRAGARSRRGRGRLLRR
jgi:hypothetical protein